MARYCNCQYIIVCMLILVKLVYCLFVDSPHTNVRRIVLSYYDSSTILSFTMFKF